MPETGRRYLAPTQQGTGDALTPENAAAASTRLTVEAVLKAAAIADPTLKASGSPTNVAIEMCWRADLGNYTGIGSFIPTSAHGGVSATRQLRHCSVNSSGTEIAHEVTRNHATLSSTVTGEANVACIVGTRTSDPRASNEKDRIINMGTITRYGTTLDRQFVNVAIAAGVALLPNGTTQNYGTGAWTTGNIFETVQNVGYDFVRWDGIKWKQYQHILVPSTNATFTSYSFTDCFFENIKGFIRNTSDADFTVVVDGLYGRGWSQACFRLDFGTHHVFKNLDMDAQLIVGEPIPSMTQFATGTSGTSGFITIDSFICKNCWDAVDTPGDYQQGDGVVGNRSCHDIYVTNGIFENMGDGGIDTKSYAADPNGFALYCENIDSINCKRSFRVHGGNTIETSGGGIFNFYYFKNCHSIRPWGDAHLQITGGTFTWENPDDIVAMEDGTVTAAKVTTAGGQVDHILGTLRDLTYDVNIGSPSAEFEDNTSTYPTEADAVAHGAFRTLIQEVTGPGWVGEILVNGVEYDFVTLQVTEGDTTQIVVTNIGAGEVQFSVVPAESGDVTSVNPTTANIRWNNTDGSIP